MKNLLRIFSLIICIFVLLWFSNCNNSERLMKCFDEKIVSNEKQDTRIITALESTVKKWQDADLEYLVTLKRCNWKVSKKILYNNQKNKCILLLLQQDRNPEVKVDFVNSILAVKEGDDWVFYYAGMPSFMMSRIEWDYPDAIPFNVMERNAIERIVKSGYIHEKDCSINDEYIDGWYDENLVSGNKKYLTPQGK